MKTFLLAALLLSSQIAHGQCMVMIQDTVSDDVSEYHFAKEGDAINFLRLAKKGQPGIATLVECSEGDLTKDKPTKTSRG